MLTGVSLLLAPKPKEPNQIKQIKQDDLTGPSRYNSTYGFDSVATSPPGQPLCPFLLASMSTRDGITSGGIVVTPDLVWSRLFSYGNHQIAKLLYAGGEHGAAIPGENSIYIGTQPLSKLSNFNYAVYYKRTRQQQAESSGQNL